MVGLEAVVQIVPKGKKEPKFDKIPVFLEAVLSNFRSFKFFT